MECNLYLFFTYEINFCYNQQFTLVRFFFDGKEIHTQSVGSWRLMINVGDMFFSVIFVHCIYHNCCATIQLLARTILPLKSVSRSVKLQLAFASRAITGFSLLEIHDQDFYFLLNIYYENIQ
jgi:hypothetical protein